MQTEKHAGWALGVAHGLSFTLTSFSSHSVQEAVKHAYGHHLRMLQPRRGHYREEHKLTSHSPYQYKLPTRCDPRLAAKPNRIADMIIVAQRTVDGNAALS